MKVALGIPFWGEDPHRLRNMDYIWKKMETIFPWNGMALSTKSTNRGAARNELVKQAFRLKADVIVLCDADTFPEEYALRQAIGSAYEQGGLHFAYDNFQQLTEEGTREICAGGASWSVRVAARGPGSLGGCMAIRPSDWKAAGGSPELDGWGFEDVMFAVQARTFLRDNTWHPGIITCLWHPNECDPSSAQYENNISVCRSVEALSGKPEELRNYMESDPYWR